MSKKEEIESKTEALITPILEENSFELVDVEYVKEAGTYYLRAFIDKPGGITVDDCELVSRAMSELLDAEDYVEDAYIFEVSSPGLGRPLKKEKDFIRSMGQEVEVRTYKMKEAGKLRQKEFIGILSGYDKDTVTIKNENDEEIVFDKPEISLIRLTFDF